MIIQKAILVISLVIVFNLLLSVNYIQYWGYNKLYDKMQFVETELENDFDAIIFGTSRTHFGLNPTIIDSISGLNTLNIGIGGIMNPQIYQVLERIIKQTSTKYIFVEFSNVSYPIQNNLTTARFLFWLDFDYTSKWSSYFLSENCEKNNEYAFNVMKAFAARKVNLGMGKDWLQFLNNPPDGKYSGSQNKGFLSLEKAKEFDGKIKTMGEEFRLDGDITERKNLLRKLNSIESQEFVDSDCKLMVELLNSYIKLAERHGKELIYFIPPLIEYPELIFPNYYSLEKRNRINLSNPEEYPELYRKKNLYDEGHFNDKGSKLYSIEFSKKITKMVKSEFQN